DPWALAGSRAVAPAGFDLAERRHGVFQVVLGHQLVGGGQVLVVPDLLEVPPDQLLVGLRHPVLLGSWFGCQPGRSASRERYGPQRGSAELTRPRSPLPAARGRAARSGCARTPPRRRCRCTLAAGSCRSRARRPVV